MEFLFSESFFNPLSCLVSSRLRGGGCSWPELNATFSAPKAMITAPKVAFSF